MYNDIIMIFLCVFAVYGVYAVIREISMLFLRKKRVVAAVRIHKDMSKDEQNDAIMIAENYIYTHSFLERAPIIISDGNSFDDIRRYGYDIYIRQTEEK